MARDHYLQEPCGPWLPKFEEQMAREAVGVALKGTTTDITVDLVLRARRKMKKNTYGQEDCLVTEMICQLLMEDRV